jgi:hypothetical protein
MVNYDSFFDLVPFFHSLNHKPGVLLNTSEIQTNQVILRLSLKNKEFASNEFLDKIKVNVITLSNENYNYNLYISKLADADVSNPVTLYTNIKNGYGVLSSSFTKEIIVKVN